MVNTEVRPKGGGGDLYPASTYLHDAIMAIPREKESTGFFTAMKFAAFDFHGFSSGDLPRNVNVSSTQ